MGAFQNSKPRCLSKTNPIDTYLGSGDSLAHLQAHAARLLRLQRQLASLLPPTTWPQPARWPT